MSDVVTPVKSVRRVFSSQRNDNKSYRKYKCSFDGCYSSFTNRKSLMRHKMIIHLKQNEIYCEYPDCEYKTFNKRKFDKHIENHNIYSELKPQTIVCHYKDCNEVFNDKKSWIKHRNGFHRYNCKVQCTHSGCNFTAQSNAHLKKHLTKHSSETPFVCSVDGCGQRFKRETSLKSHSTVHQLIKVSEVSQKSKKKSDRKYKCSFDDCHKTFTTNCNLIRHQTTIHLKQDAFYCEYPDCEFRTFSKIVFNEHIGNHSNYSELSSQTIVCHYEGCNEEFNDKKSWFAHRKSVHRYKCGVPCTHPGCQYMAHSNAHLKIHLTKHSNDFPFVCSVEGCGKRFKRKTTLTSHLEMHKNEHFECTFEGCGKTYESKARLSIHMKIAHIRDTLYSCEWPGCEFQTYVKRNYQRHQKVHGGKTYSCDYHDCNAKYKDNEALRAHRFKQHGIGNGFECSWPGCEFKAFQKCIVKYHERIHINDKKYACTWPGCQYRSIASDYIRGHMKTHQK